MFGVSFTELLLISAVALIVVGPNRLPMMLGTLGRWSNKARRTLFEVRHQSGIDEILRSEGISGGLHEIRALKSAVRGDLSSFARNAVGGAPSSPANPSAKAPQTAPNPDSLPPADPYAGVTYDRSREYPDEGCDAYGAIPDDLWSATHPESAGKTAVLDVTKDPAEASAAQPPRAAAASRTPASPSAPPEGTRAASEGVPVARSGASAPADNQAPASGSPSPADVKP